MKISAKRKELLTNSLKALNDTIGGNMSDIIKAESEVKKHLPKIGLYLEYGDCTDRWYLTDIKGKEIEL